MSYFQDIRAGIRTTVKGLSLTLRHLRNATKRRTPVGISNDTYFDQQNGLVTLQYPQEQLPIPDNGRYRLRNEIDDCIVCDKCAKVCPVDCITIDAIKATEEIGRASDGSPIRLYAGKFDIDMAKCCYCGLCTVVCPTECLTMDKKFDYSEFELGKLTYQFSNLTSEQADEKRSLYEQFLREKEEAKRQSVVAKAATDTSSDAGTNQTVPITKPAARPVFRPTARPATPPREKESENSEGSAMEHPLTDATPTEMERIAQGGLESTKHPVFQPTQKPKTDVPNPTLETTPSEPLPADRPAETPVSEPPKAKPAPFRPTMKPGASAPSKSEAPLNSASSEVDTASDATSNQPTPAPKPGGFRPTMKPPAKVDSQQTASETPTPKPAFRPTMKPAKPTDQPIEEAKTDVPIVSETPTPKPPAFRPTMKPAKPAPPETETVPDVADKLSPEETPSVEPTKPKPAFRPTMKPATVDPKQPEDVKQASSPTDTTSPLDVPTTAEAPKPKPAFRPTMKPKPKSDGDNQ